MRPLVLPPVLALLESLSSNRQTTLDGGEAATAFTLPEPKHWSVRMLMFLASRSWHRSRPLVAAYETRFDVYCLWFEVAAFWVWRNLAGRLEHRNNVLSYHQQAQYLTWYGSMVLIASVAELEARLYLFGASENLRRNHATALTCLARQYYLASGYRVSGCCGIA